MNTAKQTMGALIEVSSILVFAAMLLVGNGWAQTAGSENPTEVDVSAQPDGADFSAQPDLPDFSTLLEAPNLSGTGSQGASREERQQWRAAREARTKERVEQIRLAKENAAQNKAVPTAVSRAATLTGIEVSFKLDPRPLKGSYMGEGWVSPPIALSAGARTGTTPTVEARVQALDANGQMMNLSPEWIPADPEMVTVTPSQGNEVQITVRHAGQSSLQVTSQRASKKLSIMAWYQDDSLQVEISEKP